MNQEQIQERLEQKYERMVLKKKETAQELNVGQTTIDRLRKTGELSSKKIAGQVMFSVDEVARYLAEA